jgi:glutamyl-tRNA reductase
MPTGDRSGRPDTVHGRDQGAAARVIAALLAQAEEIRVDELARASRRMRGLTETEREIVDTVTRQLVSSMLHEPTARLCAGGPDGRAHVEAVVYLFALPSADETTNPRL